MIGDGLLLMIGDGLLLYCPVTQCSLQCMTFKARNGEKFLNTKQKDLLKLSMIVSRTVNEW